jgi:hypothetical protein
MLYPDHAVSLTNERANGPVSAMILDGLVTGTKVSKPVIMAIIGD